jgi:hypothetical protein
MENPNFRILSFFGEPNIAMALAALGFGDSIGQTITSSN